jgi:hypothetical protein
VWQRQALPLGNVRLCRSATSGFAARQRQALPSGNVGLLPRILYGYTVYSLDSCNHVTKPDREEYKFQLIRIQPALWDAK